MPSVGPIGAIRRRRSAGATILAVSAVLLILLLPTAPIGGSTKAPFPAAARHSANVLLASPGPSNCVPPGCALGARPARATTPSPPASMAGPWVDKTSKRSPLSASDWTDLAWDPDLSAMLYYGGYRDTWEYANGSWKNVTKVVHGNPGARADATMVYDPVDHYVVLYGGMNRSGPNTAYYDNSTWTFANGTWTNMTANGTYGPSARYNTPMVWDAADQYVLLFGGVQAGFSGTWTAGSLNDTWKFLHGSWTNLTLSVSGAPSVRDFQQMSYDSGEGDVVLFGGYDEPNLTLDNDLYTYKSLVWTHRTPATGPPALRSGCFSDDPVDGFVLLFGGSNYYYAGGATQSIWTYQNGSWTDMSGMMDPLPSARYLNGCVLDPISRSIIMFGGWDANLVQLNDTWEFREGDINATATVSATNLEVGGRLYVNTSAEGGSWTYTYTYSGLPPGCTSANKTHLSCGITGAGIFHVNATVTDTRGSVSYPAPTQVTVYSKLGGSLATNRSVVDIHQSIRFTASFVNGSAGYSVTGYSGLPSGCSSSTSNPYDCTPSIGGNFTVVAHFRDSLGYTATSSANITVYSSIGTSFSGPAAADTGQSADFSVNASGAIGPYTYNWTTLPPGSCGARDQPAVHCSLVSAGTFHPAVKVTDSGDITTTASGTIIVTLSPTFSINATPLVGYPTLSVSLGGILIGGTSPVSVSWNLGDGRTAGGFPLHVQYATPGTYLVQVWANDSLGVSSHSETNVTVLPLPAPLSIGLSSTPIDGILDVGTNLTLSAIPTGGVGPFRYAYSGLPVGCLSQNQSQLNCVPKSIGTYTVSVQVTDGRGTQNASIEHLSVNADPKAAITDRTTSSCAPAAVEQFNATIVGGSSPFDVVWNFGDGGADVGPNVTHSYGANGSYAVSVNVTDGVGFLSRSTARVAIALKACGNGNGGGGGGGGGPGPNPSTPSSGIPLVDELGAAAAILALAAALGVYWMRRRPGSPAEAPGTSESPPAESWDEGAPAEPEAPTEP